MKLSSRKRRGSKSELNMTSMIDVIFLLLIFFIVNSSYAIGERHLESTIQSQGGGRKHKANLEPVIVEITRHGEFRLGTRDFADQKALFEVLRQFTNKSDGAFVRVSDDAPFDKAAAAIQACRDAGFATVSYIPGG